MGVVGGAGHMWWAVPTLRFRGYTPCFGSIAQAETCGSVVGGSLRLGRLGGGRCPPYVRTDRRPGRSRDTGAIRGYTFTSLASSVEELE